MYSLIYDVQSKAHERKSRLRVQRKTMTKETTEPSSDGMTGGDQHHLTGGPSGSGYSSLIRRPLPVVTVLLLGAVISYLVLFESESPFQFLPRTSQGNSDSSLDRVLKNASMSDKTVILTTSNQAWAKRGSIIDLLLESFSVGNRTNRLLNHLVIICLDQEAYHRCLAVHPHCYLFKAEGLNFSSEAHFMSSEYLQMMWARIDLLSSILEMGYNFVFTDADIMWLQDPFSHFYPDGDFQIACDRYIGNPYDINNQPNGGFTYVKSNNRTIQFYKFWYSSRKDFPGKHDQDVLNEIKNHPFLERIGVKIMFLPTAYFGGFCQLSKDFNSVCTMHANCCVGLENKIHDLKLILEDWRRFMSLPPSAKASSPSWRAPHKCRGSFRKLARNTRKGGNN